jgi:glucose-6-phosphate-specific signal transduction histidine kinase
MVVFVTSKELLKQRYTIASSTINPLFWFSVGIKLLYSTVGSISLNPIILKIIQELTSETVSVLSQKMIRKTFRKTCEKYVIEVCLMGLFHWIQDSGCGTTIMIS